MAYKWKPSKAQKEAFKAKLVEQDIELDKLRQEYKGWDISYNDNKSSLYLSNSELRIEYRISTHHLPNHNYGDTNKYRQYKGSNDFKKIEIVTNSRDNVLKKAKECLAEITADSLFSYKKTVDDFVKNYKHDKISIATYKFDEISNEAKFNVEVFNGVWIANAKVSVKMDEFKKSNDFEAKVSELFQDALDKEVNEFYREQYGDEFEEELNIEVPKELSSREILEVISHLPKDSLDLEILPILDEITSYSISHVNYRDADLSTTMNNREILIFENLSKIKVFEHPEFTGTDMFKCLVDKVCSKQFDILFECDQEEYKGLVDNLRPELEKNQDLVDSFSSKYLAINNLNQSQGGQ